MTWDEITRVVDELVELNDDNLAQRVLEDNDVQNCLLWLYDLLHGGVN